MAYPHQFYQQQHGQHGHPSSILPYPHTHIHPHVYTLHPPSSSHHYSYPHSYSSTPYSTPPTTAPPSPKFIQRAYPHLSRATTSSSTSSSSPNTSNNMHHHMSFPEQIQSASSFRPPSSQSHHSAAGPGTGTVTPAGASPYPHTHSQQHGVLQQHHHSTSGPTLQVNHPTASAADAFRHRSASPWAPPQQQQQQQSHSMYGGGSNAGHTTSSSNISGALTLFNASSSSYHSSSQQQQQHPLAQQHNHYSFPSSSSAAHFNNGHDPYHSPEPAHATLQSYGFPHQQSHHHAPYQSSSSSNVRTNLLPNHLQSYKYPSVKPESNIRSKLGGSANSSNNNSSASRLPPPQQQRSTSGGSANTSGSADSEKLHKGQAGNESKEKNSTGPTTGSANNYGIIDELNTTLYDLRDGADGPGGKPPYPYLTLIRIALLSSPSKRLTLQELYDTLEARWPGHFIGEQKGWKNTVRHNLSLNKCFKKESRHILDPGKGAYWYCDPNEEHSTSRVRSRRKDEEGEIDGEGEVVHTSGSRAGKKRARGGASAKSSSRKRKAEESPPHDADDYDAYGNSSTSFIGGNGSSINAGHVRSVKLRVGDLKLPFSAASGGPQVKRQRAISAPSPITPSFFNNLTNALQGDNTQSLLSNLGMAPFGLVPNAGVNNSIITHQSTVPHYTFPQLINNPNQSSQPPKYQFPSTTYTRALVQPTQQLPAMPSLIADRAPESGSTESSFGIETPRTIYSSNNGATRPGTAKSANNATDGGSQSRMNSFGQRAKDEQTSSSEDLARAGSNSGNGNGEGTTPGPAQAYVFPAPPQNGSNESAQTNRVFVNPPGNNTSNTLNHSSPSANNPFTAPSVDDPRNRPAPLNINSKDGRAAFSPPSATSPTRLLNQEYGDLFSTAPFGMDFGAPKATSRKGSLFGGLTAK